MASIPAIRLLIATGEAASDADELPPLVRFLIAAAVKHFVITPVGGTVSLARIRRRPCHPRSERSAPRRPCHLQAIDAPSDGVVGDDLPMTAFEDAISDFKPNHILIALRSKDHDGWQKHRLVDRVRHQFHIPITVVEIDQPGHVPGPALSE